MSKNGKTLIIGVPGETFPGERRVSLIPASIPAIKKAGLEVIVETGAGVPAGFTDNEGSYSYNQGLSQKRANTVANLLAVNGKPFTKGCSYDKAIVPNNSAKNKALNRRVEVYLYADRNKMSDPCR